LPANWSNGRNVPDPALFVAIVDDEEPIRKALRRLLRASA